MLAHLQRSAGNNAATAFLAVQRTPSGDTADAITDREHLENETYPGLTTDLKTVQDGVRARINNYKGTHGGNEPPAGNSLAQSAAGLKLFGENLIESADGKWTEAAEMASQVLNKNRIPIPARNNATDADIEYKKNGTRTGVEVKAVNSASTGQVTTVINNADQQLGARANIDWNKILVWIAHEQNRWPGAPGFAARNSDAQVVADVTAQLNGMNLPSTDVINIQMVRVPMHHPAEAVDIRATGGDGAWSVTVTKHH